MPLNSSPIRGVMIAVCLLVVLGTTAFAAPTSFTIEKTETITGGHFHSEMYEDDAEFLLRQLPAEWDGVPYRYGGTNRRGIDCSAFVQQAYEAVFDIAIPRTTSLQREIGYEVGKTDLLAGDLILFRSSASSSSRHVGIYVSENEFVHISSSRRSGGVKIEDLDQFLDNPGISLLTIRRVATVIPNGENRLTSSQPDRSNDVRLSGNNIHVPQKSSVQNRIQTRNQASNHVTRQTFDDLDRIISERSRGSVDSQKTNTLLEIPENQTTASTNPVTPGANDVILDHDVKNASSRVHHSNSKIRRSLYAGFYSF